MTDFDDPRTAEPAEEIEEGAPPEDDDRTCWVCTSPVLRRHCKIVCPRCGFTRDCSDL